MFTPHPYNPDIRMHAKATYRPWCRWGYAAKLATVRVRVRVRVRG